MKMAEGFLPLSEMARCLASSWLIYARSVADSVSQGTCGAQRLLSKRRAVVSFGFRELELIEDREHNCVWLRFAEEHPLASLDTVAALAAEVASECFGGRVGLRVLLTSPESAAGLVSHKQLLAAAGCGAFLGRRWTTPEEGFGTPSFRSVHRLHTSQQRSLGQAVCNLRTTTDRLPTPSGSRYTSSTVLFSKHIRGRDATSLRLLSDRLQQPPRAFG